MWFVQFHSKVLPQLDLQLVGVSFLLTWSFMDLSFLLVLSVRVLGFPLHFQSWSHQRSEVLDSTFIQVMFLVLIQFLEQRTEKVSCWSSWFSVSVGLIAQQQINALDS
jgi:hypothetical protein